VRIHLVTQMWPGPDDPDLGSFLVPIRDELVRLGHEVEVTSIDHRRSARSKYARLSAESIATARRFRPDVVFAHMLFPAGAAGAMASLTGRCPLVVMAHGQDVANLGEVPGVGQATRAVVRRADTVIANSRWLAEQLFVSIPTARSKTVVADCGIDLEQFEPRDAAEARAELGWEGPGASFVCVGSLIERKNVIRLADAFAEHGSGRLAFVGDGPLRSRLEGRAGVDVVGRIRQSEVPKWIAAADVLCQPSLREPFGQATLEGLAMERSVVATTVGGPPEFVTPESGVLVDPFDARGLADALAQAAAMPTPNPAARRAASAHDVQIQVGRMAAALEGAVQRSRKR
jgi:glycosyltransferase involved in cell wall biosynthesis